MFSDINSSLLVLANTLPLEIFLFLGSALEEIIPPIPAFPMMLMAGSLAQVQNYTFFGLFILALVSAGGKTLASIVVYHVSNKLEDVFVEKYGNFFGLKAGDIEKIGEKFGHGYRDYFLFTAIRALPIIPSSLVSVASGILGLNRRLFIFGTFFGTIARDLFYLYIGFGGAQFYMIYYETLKSYYNVNYVIFVLIFSFVLYFLIKKYIIKKSH